MFGNVLKKLIERKAMTMNEAAKQIGIGNRALDAIIKDSVEVPTPVLEKIMVGLDVDEREWKELYIAYLLKQSNFSFFKPEYQQRKVILDKEIKEALKPVVMGNKTAKK